MAFYDGLWEQFLGLVEPHLPEYLHWNEICWTFVYYLNEIRLWIHRNTRGMEHWEVVTFTALYCFYIFIGFEVSRWLISWLFFQDEGIVERTKKFFFRTLKKMPIIKEKIKAEMDKTTKELEQAAFPLPAGHSYITKLPAKGLSVADLDKEIKKLKSLGGYDWEKGNVSGTVYHGGKALTDVMTKVYGEFSWTNPLHPDIFPGVRKMEAEVVRMTLKLFNGNEDCCGTMTIGGTESILLACKAYRDRAYERGIKNPEIIAPVSAHAAFDKACHYFRIKMVHVPVDPKTYKCDLKAMRRAINRRTVLLVGSCPEYPHGIIDPIEEMSKLALKYNIGLHVDACLGGFLVPFMKKAGYDLPLFDFRVPGVSSISADTHKYGYAPKGSSVIMYNSKDLRKFQYHCAPDWTGGIYACPTIPGSRAGGIIAATWASLMMHGEDGYVECTRKIIITRKYIERELRKMKHVYVLGEPQVSVVAFSSHDFDIYRVSSAMAEKGWSLNSLQFPARRRHIHQHIPRCLYTPQPYTAWVWTLIRTSIHITITMPHTEPGVADRLLKDIRDIVNDLMKNPDAKPTGVGAIYGMAQSIPDRSMVSELACSFLDCYYSTKPVEKIQNGGPVTLPK